MPNKPSRFMFVALVCGILVGLTPHSIAEHHAQLAEKAEDWDSLFRRTSGWSGADGIYSISLSGNDFPGAGCTSKTLFVFGDTFVGEVGPSTARLAGSTVVHNTAALMKGCKPKDDHITFHWRTDDPMSPQAVFAPATANADPGEWYWPLDGVALDETLYLFAQRMKRFEAGAMSFATDGVALFTASADHPRLFLRYDEIEVPLYGTDRKGREILFGGSVMANTSASGSPNPDGYVYVYGTLDDGEDKKLIAARVRSERFDDFSGWRFWDGIGWSSSMDSVSPLVENLSPEFSISPLPSADFALVYQVNGISRDVAVRMGKSPVGPFGPPKVVWRCPEPMQDPDIFTYNAKAHPHLSPCGELLISYHVNTRDFMDHYRNADLYRPRFVRVPLAALR